MISFDAADAAVHYPKDRRFRVWGFTNAAVVLFLIGKKAQELIKLRHYSSAGKEFQVLRGSLEGEIVPNHPRAFLLRCDDVATDTIHFRVGASLKYSRVEHVI